MRHFRGGTLYYFEGLSLLESAFISNLFSWSKKKKFKEPIYKKDSEMAEEIHCEVRSVEYLRKKMSRLGIVKIGKRENLKFNGATPYILNVEKIVEIGDSEIINKINLLLVDGVRKNVGASPKKCDRLLQKFGEGVRKNVTSYIEADTLSIHTEETPTPFSESEFISSEPEKSPRATNDFLESKAQEFLDLTALDDLKPTERQTTIVMFKTRLQVLLRQHDKTLEGFMDAARHHYVTERPNQPQYVIRPHNFIERTKDGIRQCPFLDHIGKGKAEKKNTITMEEARQKILSGEW